MIEAIYPEPAQEVVSTLLEIYSCKNRTEIVELLTNAHSWFDEIHYDNWNGGSYTWALRLEIPMAIYASIEINLQAIEQELCQKLNYLNRIYPNNIVGEVSITPIKQGTAKLSQRIAPAESEVRRLWSAGRFRLFLSHVSEHRIAVGNLKIELAIRGVDSFVAHEDIEPSREWEKEIELALKSMYALAALYTPKFHISKWTDQEIGWALGRGILVIPIRLGLDPYGLLRKIQGISGSLEGTRCLAESIVRILLSNVQTHSQMRQALVDGFQNAQSYVMAIEICKLVMTVNDFTDEEITIMLSACKENEQVIKAYKVVEKIRNKFGYLPTPVPASQDDILPPF